MEYPWFELDYYIINTTLQLFHKKNIVQELSVV